MQKNKISLVFFGSGNIARQTLESLCKHFDIEVIITKPSTKLEMQKACPKTQVMVANNKKDLNNLFAENSFKSQLGVLVDYGVILDDKILKTFKFGIINSHFSLLPEWRGADPIVFSILSGQAKTGVSLMLVDSGIDTGKIITQKSLLLSRRGNIRDLNQKLVNLSNSLLKEYIPKYMAGDVMPFPQPQPDKATYSHKLTKQSGKIDWTKSATQIEREIRAYLDWPKSYTELSGRVVIITEAEVLEQAGKPGQVTTMGKNIIIFCGKKALLIKKLKPAGKKEMSSEAFLAGHSI